MITDSGDSRSRCWPLARVRFDGGSSARWDLGFASAVGSQIAPGPYEGATRYPFESPMKPGLSVSGPGRGCNTLTGSFTVLEAKYNEDDTVERFSADFEQHCEGKAQAIRYNASPQSLPEQ